MILNNKNNLCLHNLETQITNDNLHIKNIAPTVIEQITASLLVSKNNEMTRTNTFVLHQTTEQNDIIHAIDVEVIHEIIDTKLVHKTDIALHLEIDSVTTRVLLLHNTLDHDITITKEIRNPIALPTELLTDPFTDITLVTDMYHARIQEITTVLQDTHLLLDHPHDHEILDILDHVHIQTKGINLIQYNHKPKMIPSTSNYTCISQLKWQTLEHLQAGFTLYTHIHQQTKFNVIIHQD